MGNLLQEALTETIGILKLEPASIKKTAKGELGKPFLILIITALLLGLIYILWRPGNFLYTTIFFLIFFLCTSFILNGIYWFFAKLFGGRGTFLEQYKPVTSAYLLLLLGWIPIVHFLVMIWALVIDIVVVREVHKLSTVKAAAVVLIPTLIITLVAIFMAVIVGTMIVITLLGKGAAPFLI